MPKRNERYELTGIVSSPGFVVGPLWIAHEAKTVVYQPKGNPESEASALKQAIQIASMELTQLLTGCSGPAADILEFQLAMLADDTFYEAALNRISIKGNASEAWRYVLGQECTAYLEATDEMFQARALDLEDIQARVLRHLYNQSDRPMPVGVIVMADNLTPTSFMTHNWINGGLALTKGSTASHVAVLARQFNVPMVVNLQGALPSVCAGERTMLLANVDSGKLIVSPTSLDEKTAKPKPVKQSLRAVLHPPMLTRSGQPLSLMINLAHVRELENINVNTVDGIGLVRTEFLFAEHGRRGFYPDEETQYQNYCKILNWAKGKPVFFRTLDEGGDKPSIGHLVGGLGSKLRGIRLSLAQPDIFCVQIRALLRAAAYAPLQVTLPMVSTASDLSGTLDLFAGEAHKLAAARIACVRPPVGIMVEMPSVAKNLQSFSDAAHFSIGTNDLLQYTLDEPRDAGGVKSQIDNPAVMALIKNTVLAGITLDKPVSVCGDAASDRKALQHLLAAGITQFSVSPPSHTFIVDAIRAQMANEGT